VVGSFRPGPAEDSTRVHHQLLEQRVFGILGRGRVVDHGLVLRIRGGGGDSHPTQDRPYDGWPDEGRRPSFVDTRGHGSVVPDDADTTAQRARSTAGRCFRDGHGNSGRRSGPLHDRAPSPAPSWDLGGHRVGRTFLPGRVVFCDLLSLGQAAGDGSQGSVASWLHRFYLRGDSGR
jgi:hypothetical protein